MKQNNCTWQQVFLSLKDITFSLFFLTAIMLLHAGPVSASIPADLTFKWQANPPQDNVTGYRLYFSTQSRFDSSGNPKANFSYDYYIDFSNSLLCNNKNSAVGCQYLDPDELSCSNLNGSTPKCTISTVQGTNYFALTACSDTLESDFTREIKVSPQSVVTSQTSTSQNIIPVIQQLLLK